MSEKLVYLKQPVENEALVIANYFIGNKILNKEILTRNTLNLFKPVPNIANKILFIIANNLSPQIFDVVKEVLLLEDLSKLLKCKIVEALFIKEYYVEKVIKQLYSDDYNFDFLINSVNEVVQSKEIKVLLGYKAKKENKLIDFFQHNYIFLTPIEIKSISKSAELLENYIRKLNEISNPIYAAIFLEWLIDFNSSYKEEFKERFGLG
jgi:hypothetical protein